MDSAVQMGQTPMDSLNLALVQCFVVILCGYDFLAQFPSLQRDKSDCVNRESSLISKSRIHIWVMLKVYEFGEVKG